jgi:hypothetical protein
LHKPNGPNSLGWYLQAIPLQISSKLLFCLHGQRIEFC